MPAPIALVDCNNFYASCERVLQPELRGKPVVVLSNNDGCAIACSNETKALGIEVETPWHLHRERFARDGVIVRSSNHTFYGDMSARVMRVLASFTAELEVLFHRRGLLRPQRLRALPEGVRTGAAGHRQCVIRGEQCAIKAWTC